MWYTANILLKGNCQDTPQEDILWQENIVLLEASSEEEARAKGMDFGRAYEVRYETVGGVVQWQLWGIERICDIGTNILQNGTELFSRFLRDSEVQSLLTRFDDAVNAEGE